MVSIAIIAVLISILLPALTSARSHARSILCASNQRQLHLAISLYATDYSATILPSRWGTTPSNQEQFSRVYWNGILAKFGYIPPIWNDGVQNWKHILYCPDSSKYFQRPGLPASQIHDEYGYNTDYGLNAYLAARSTNGTTPTNVAGMSAPFQQFGAYPNLILISEIATDTYTNWNDFETFRWRHRNGGTLNTIFEGGHSRPFDYEDRASMWSTYSRRP